MQPRKSSARVGLTLDDMRMSMGCISGTQLLLMEGQDRMSNRVAGAQRMVEQAVEYKRRSGELTSTRSLADLSRPNNTSKAFASLLCVEGSTSPVYAQKHNKSAAHFVPHSKFLTLILSFAMPEELFMSMSLSIRYSFPKTLL